jgi:hypothetical protein
MVTPPAMLGSGIGDASTPHVPRRAQALTCSAVIPE